MRAANVIVSTLGVAGVVIAAALAWRGRNDRLLAQPRVRDGLEGESRRQAAVDAVRTLALLTAAGFVAGVLVPGLGGRLLMRIMAATSGGAAQGRRTEAEELVGEVTQGGTMAIIVFVGLLGGLVTVFPYLVARRWLPSTAGPAGLVVGLLLLGTIGVGDPMSPENVDFEILRPTWLAVVMISVLALLFGATFTALAARLATRPTRVGYASLVLLAFPPLVFGAVAYVVGRVVAVGRTTTLLARPDVLLAGRVVIGLATLLAAISAAAAIAQIV